jgi:predicted Fe-Mo cluster-binding NifX family protein
MGHKVAIAAQPERMVTQHFGRATVFHVFDVRGDGWELLETRVNDPACVGDTEGDAHESMLAAAAELIADCEAVLAARIGPGAVRTLNDRGIETYAMHALVEDALAALSEEYARIDAEESGSALDTAPDLSQAPERDTEHDIPQAQNPDPNEGVR